MTAAPRVCPECGVSFAPHHVAQAFCTPVHKTAFHNRNMKRGQVLLPLAQIYRQGKRGRTEDRAYAFGEMCRLLDAWNAEDAKAGRSPESVVARKRAAGWTAADLAA